MKVLLPCVALLAVPAWAQVPTDVVPGDGPSIQRAVDRHPGQPIFVPAGDYPIDVAVRLTTSGSGLWGPGRIIQENPAADIVDLENVDGVSLRDLTLMRPADRAETHRPGIRVVRCRQASFTDLRVNDNQGDLASIFAAYCDGLSIRDCSIRNYSRIAIDDRTTIPFLGYAFKCINGTGIMVRHSTGTLIQRCRIVETRMLPTRELTERYRLGNFVKKNARKGSQVPQDLWDKEYFNGWHQGAAIQVTKGETTDEVRILDNYIENAAQGVDIHGDHVIMAHNIVNNAFIGMKAMHGSRNVIIVANQFIRNDLWCIQLQPGSASHSIFTKEQAGGPDPADPEALTWSINRPGANIDGHSVVANNIVSDFGYGTEHWNWDPAHTAPIQFNVGANPKRSPPETDVVISGNIVYDTGRDKILVDGKPQAQPPRYQYAVRIAAGENGPRGLHFSGNLLDPGTGGVSNLPLPR